MPTNWGIMATGKIAHKFAKALNSSDESKLYAVASRNKAKAEEFGKLFGSEKCYGSYEELVRDENIDIIYVATPMSCHYENIKLCFEHGKNVLCEKSVTVDTKELEDLIAIAKEKKLFFMEAMWTKCLPHFLKAKEWSESGRIGRIKAISADFCNLVPFDEKDRLFRPDLGGGVLLDMGIYPLSLATAFLGGKPSEIISSVNVDRLGVDMDEAILLKYPSAFANIVAGFDMPNENRAVVVGTEGKIVFEPCFFCTETVLLYDKDSNLVEKSVHPFRCNGYEFEIEETQNCMKDGLLESRLNPLQDTLDNMIIVDKLRKEWGL